MYVETRGQFFRSPFSSSVWVLGIKLRSSGLRGELFTCWAMALALPWDFWQCYRKVIYTLIQSHQTDKNEDMAFPVDPGHPGGGEEETAPWNWCQSTGEPSWKMRKNNSQLCLDPANVADNSRPPVRPRALSAFEQPQWLVVTVIMPFYSQTLAVLMVLIYNMACHLQSTSRSYLAKGLFSIFYRWDSSARKEQCFVEGQIVLQQQDRDHKSGLITPIQHSFCHSITYRKYSNSATTPHLGEKSTSPLTLSRNILLWISSFP